MNMQKDFFTKISDVAEKDRIFKDLGSSASEILAKSLEPNSELMHFKAESYQGNELTCVVQTKKSQLQSQGELILQFMLGSEKYLISTQYQVRQDKVIVQTKAQLFHLQRREDFRLRLPESFQGIFALEKQNSKPNFGKFHLVDLSGGGCRFQIKANVGELNIGDQVEGALILPQRDKISIKGTIRHEKDDDSTKTLMAGVQFVDLRPLEKNRIIAVVMDLYRELFSRLS